MENLVVVVGRRRKPIYKKLSQGSKGGEVERK